MAYTPGLQVTPRTTYRAHRQLPIDGEVLVRVGDRVQARDIVARTELPGNVFPINLANQLALPPGDVRNAVVLQEGDQVNPGDVLARTNGVFGLFKSEFTSKVAGRIESISSITGQVIVRGTPIPVEVRAYLAGEVVEVTPQSRLRHRGPGRVCAGHLRHRGRGLRPAADGGGPPGATAESRPNP